MSTSPVNPGVANLLQLLTNLNSPVVSSKAATSALEEASPSDIVQLTAEATQLQGIDTLLGINRPSDNSSTLLSEALANLGNSGMASPNASGTAPSGGSSSSASSTASGTADLASYEAALQSEVTQALLGTGGDLSGSLLDLTG